MPSRSRKSRTSRTSRNSRNSQTSRRKTKNDGFFRPGSFLANLMGIGTNKSRSKKTEVYKQHKQHKEPKHPKERKEQHKSSRKSRSGEGSGYRDFVAKNYQAARAVVVGTGEAVQNVTTGTFRQLGLMWQQQKGEHHSSRAKESSSYKEGSHKDRGVYRDFVKSNYHEAQEVVARTGKTGSDLTQNTMKTVAKWWKKGKPSTSYKHLAGCKYGKASRGYGSRKSKNEKGAVVCMCALIRKKKESSKKSVSYKMERGGGSRKKIKLNKGTLTQFGYHASITNKAERREMLKLAVDKYGWVAVMRKLNLISVFNRQKQPDKAKRLRADAKWVSAMYKNK